MQEEIGRGKFTLRSMYTQFESMSNMGGLGKIMGAMPGMSGMGGMMGGVDDKFKRMQVRDEANLPLSHTPLA